MHAMLANAWHRASPALRDRFLNALDSQDAAAIEEAARVLLGCIDALPGTTCILLGLAPGSTYGDAAAAITASAQQS
jgi:hypothetical protein